MASAAVEMVVMEIVEDVVQAAVAQAVEEEAVAEVDQAVVGAVQQAAEEQVQVVVEQEVEAAVEAEVEVQVAAAVEEEVDNAVEEAGEGYWRNMLKDKVLPAIIAGVTAGLVIEAVERSIDESKKDGGGGGSPSKDTETGQTAASKVLQVVDAVTKRWKTKLEEYQSSSTDLGTFTYKTATKDAARTIGVLVTNMKTELQAAKDVAIKSTANKSWDKNIDEFKWRIANACEDLLAVFEVKKTGAKLKQLDFPPDSDKTAINDILDKQMPNYKAIIKAEVKKHLSAAVNGLAKKSASKAVKALIREPLSRKITTGFNAEVRPDVVDEAKDAARAEATVVMNSKMGDINKHAAIPVYGIATLKKWMEDNVAPVAKKEATRKALAAAHAVLELPPSQIKMMKISKTAREQVMKEYQTKIKQVAKEAAEEVIKQALKGGKKNNTR